VSYTYGAYRITELVFGAIVVQITTVLLPMLSRELDESPRQAPVTLLDTVSLVSFVTLPAATVMAVLSAPIVGLLFGGGRFDSHAVAITGATLAAYAFSLVGTGHVKVMASAFFAQKNTKTPAIGSLVALLTFTVACWYLVGPYGTPGIGVANTIAMAAYGVFLSALYASRYGFEGASLRPAASAVLRQVIGSILIGFGVWAARPWLGAIDHTSLEGALRMAVVLAVAGGVYLTAVTMLGGRELATLISTFKPGGRR
jgi:putative peptidoglycan lipid II flippase